MPRPPAQATTLLVCVLAIVGCVKVHTAGKLPLAMAQMSPNSVGLELVFTRFAFGDDQLNGALWAEIDEQQIPVETRRRLADNGFRVGLVGGRLPASLERLLQSSQAEQPAGELLNFELANEPVIRGRIVQSPAGVPKRIIVSGEQRQHEQLAVLFRDAGGAVTGRTYALARGVLVAKTHPQSDGRVRLELVPEVEHGAPQRRFIPRDGYARFEFGPAADVFDHLRLETTLAPGQTLVVGTFPDRPATLGYQYFTEQESGPLKQKLLLIRLARTQHDELTPVPSTPEP
jgi:hypothetical protein